MLAGSFFCTGLGLGLGLEDSGLALALGLDCCWTCYKSANNHNKQRQWTKGVFTN